MTTWTLPWEIRPTVWRKDTVCTPTLGCEGTAGVYVDRMSDAFNHWHVRVAGYEDVGMVLLRQAHHLSMRDIVPMLEPRCEGPSISAKA